MIVKIKLLSDLCVSSGEVYNSYVDTDVVHDEYGLPYIPAKRIKGCIREAALELKEWGCLDGYDEIFGEEGHKQSLFALDNAYLENYDVLVKDLVSCKGKSFSHPQRVLDLYTYTRTQTAMDENGVAEATSLRTTRAVNKGNVFVAKLTENQKLTEEQKTALANAISMVKHIGSDRTRGLGLVEMSLEEEAATPVKETKTREYADLNKIYYTITLKAPLLCKSSQGSQEKTHDYIEGGKILGVLAQNLDEKTFKELMDYENGNSIIASNAYISDGNCRFVPLRSSLQKRKNQTYENGCMNVADMLVHGKIDEQMVPVGAGYVDGKGHVKQVDVEINYHHSRTEDKSIGKATGKDGSAFYQLGSIKRGQQFTGFILANKEQASIVTECLESATNIRMGTNRNAEYGSVEVEVQKVEAVEKAIGSVKNDFFIKLNSAAILYNENGIPSADVADLKVYLAQKLGLAADCLTIEKAFLTYETIGGYNVKWQRRKPIFTALGKGTVCRIKSSEPVDVSVLQEQFIGERVAEGYGELEILDNVTEIVELKRMQQEDAEKSDYASDIVERLKVLEKRDELKKAGTEEAMKMVSNGILKEKEINAVIGKLTLLSRTTDRWEEIEEQIKGIEDKKKRELAGNVIYPVKKYFNNCAQFLLEEKNTSIKIFLFAYLNHLKYKLYENKKGESK